MSDLTNQPSDVDNWSHVRETINMLYLAVCQIEATMADSNESVDTLTVAFTKLAHHTHDVSQQIQGLTKPEELEAFKGDISQTASELTSNINSSVRAFQFYDRVCQRLDHVSRSLEQVSGVMSSNESIHDPDAWRAIQDNISSSYTMDAERKMFEYIMNGSSVEEALLIYQNHHQEINKPANGADEIELF